jgi:WD40 repeat protein
MKEHENSFNSEAIDAQTERWPSGLSQDEHRLIQALYASSQAYARENEQSLERIWTRFVQSQGHPALLQETQQKQPASEQFVRKGKAMREDIYQGTGFSTPTSWPAPVKRPRRAIWRALSVVAAAAVVLILILGWVLLFSGMRPSTASKKPATQVGAHQAQQKELSAGALLCSFSDNATGYPVPIQPTLDWSASRQVAVTYHNLIASAQNCTAQSANLLPQAQQATWSPDGKRLLTLASGEAEVLDASTGHVIATFQGNAPGDTIDQSVWLSNGTIVSAVQTTSAKTGDLVTSGSAGPVLMQVWNASTGALIRTAITFPSGTQLLGLNVGMLPISPDGKYVAVQETTGGDVEVWNIASGKLVNSIPYHQSDSGLVSVSALAWSPDGAYLALGLPNAPQVQIWSVASGQLTATFTDSDTWAHVIGALAWSPNGQYLAESGSAIHLWDVKAQKIVVTFGKVNEPSFIATLAWSHDGTMLASTTNIAAQMGQSALLQNTVNIWKLS